MEQIQTIEDLLGPYHPYQRAAPLLRKINCISASQILDPHTGSILKYSTIKKDAGLNPRGRHPNWYRFLCDKIKHQHTNLFELTDSNNGHLHKWKKSTEKIAELINIDLTDAYFQKTENLFLEIDL